MSLKNAFIFLILRWKFSNKKKRSRQKKNGYEYNPYVTSEVGKDQHKDLLKYGRGEDESCHEGGYSLSANVWRDIIKIEQIVTIGIMLGLQAKESDDADKWTS